MNHILGLLSISCFGAATIIAVMYDMSARVAVDGFFFGASVVLYLFTSFGPNHATDRS